MMATQDIYLIRSHMRLTTKELYIFSTYKDAPAKLWEVGNKHSVLTPCKCQLLYLWSPQRASLLFKRTAAIPSLCLHFTLAPTHHPVARPFL